jgi:ceramide glucosyltransferase
MTHGVLAPGILAFACLPLAYYAYALLAAWRFRQDVKKDVTAAGGQTVPALNDSSSRLPPVSILKPIRGLDRHARDHFSSFCRLDYPDYEVLFAVADEDDPAIPVIRQLLVDFPRRAIRLIVGVPALGPSSKVSKLCRLAREAQHDVLVVSDSDITVPTNYLRAVVAPLGDDGVGAVSCLYRGVPDGSVWSDLEAIGISTEFAPGVIVARQLEGVRFTLGATMATTRTRLAEIGGFEALLDYCADDFELGRRITAHGHRIDLAACTVSTECAARGWVEFFRHELRWAITLRHSRPWGYAGRILLTQGLPWSLGAAAVAPAWSVAAAYLLAYLTLRLALAWAVGVGCLQDDTVRRRWWLIPVRDSMSFIVSIASFCSNRIDWRGRSFELQHGRLVPVRVADAQSGRPFRNP